MTVRLYCRVSTAEQADSGLGLGAQRRKVDAEAAHRGWQTVEFYVDAGVSGKTLDRPEMNRLLSDVRRGDVVVVSKLDRLPRSLLDAVGLMDQAKRKGWWLVALDLGVDTTTPTGRLVANVMASVAEWEREVIGQRTSEAMQAAKAQGVRLGRPSLLPLAVRGSDRGRSGGGPDAEADRRPPERRGGADAVWREVVAFLDRQRAEDCGERPAGGSGWGCGGMSRIDVPLIVWLTRSSTALVASRVVRRPRKFFASSLIVPLSYWEGRAFQPTPASPTTAGRTRRSGCR